jgi:hypothetical protein
VPTANHHVGGGDATPAVPQLVLDLDLARNDVVDTGEELPAGRARLEPGPGQAMPLPAIVV